MTQVPARDDETAAPERGPAPPAAVAGSTNGAAGAGVDARAVYDAILELLQVAAEDPTLSERMALSHVRVTAHFADVPPLAMTMLWDRNPIEVVARETPDADLHIHADTREWMRFWSGEYHLPMAIARGEVSYSGPVRRFLRAAPIVRRLGAEFRQIMSEQQQSPTQVRPGGTLEEGTR